MKNGNLHTHTSDVEEDDFYWELLEEQHNHDVVISGAMEGGEEDE